MTIARKEISLIIIANNNEKEIYNTVERVIGDLNEQNNIIFEIVLVDNKSKDKTRKEMQRAISTYENIEISYLYEKELGVSSAIYTGLLNAKYSASTVLTGHDVWDTRCLAKLIQSHDGENIVLGYRDNKRGNRPIIKYVSSILLIVCVNTVFKLKLVDLNGLLIFNTKDFLKNMEKSGGHAHVIYPLVRLTRNGVKVIQFPALMNKNHHKRETRKINDSFPKLKPIYTTIKAIFLLSISK